MSISDSTLRHDVFTSINSVLALATSTFGASSTPKMYGGYPDWNSTTFPCIIIEPIRVREDEHLFNTDRSSSQKTISVILHIYSKNHKDLDYISDGITNTLRTNNISGVFLFDISDSNEFITANEQKVKGKTLSITYLRR